MKLFFKCYLLILLLFITIPYRVFAEGLTGDNTLDSGQAVEIALAADLSLQAAKLNMEIAQKDYETAKRILSLGGSYVIVDPNTGELEEYSRIFGVNSSGTYDTTSDHSYSKWYMTYKMIDKDNYSYNLSYSPFNLGYEKNIKIKELDYINQHLAYKNTRIGLIVAVRNAFAEAFQKKELAKMALQDLKLLKNQYTRAANLFDLGKISHLDLMDAEQKMKAAEVKMRQTALNQKASLLKLSVLLKKDNLQNVVLNDSALEWATVDRIDLPATIDICLENILNIKAATINIRIAKIQDLMNSFYLLKNVYVFTGGDKTQDNSTTYYGLGFSGALDDSYFRDKSSSKKRLEAARLNLEVTIRDMRAKILETYQNWEISELGLIPAQESLKIAKERLRIISQKHEKGMASNLELDQAYLTFNNAGEAYWEAWLYLQQIREQFYQSADGNPVLKQ